MSYSMRMAMGEIAYDGYHAIDEEYTPFKELPEPEQIRWAQAANNSMRAWTEPGGVNVARWKEETRAAHASLREHKKAEPGFASTLPLDEVRRIQAETVDACQAFLQHNASGDLVHPGRKLTESGQLYVSNLAELMKKEILSFDPDYESRVADARSLMQIYQDKYRKLKEGLKELL